jgi:hypothetical protein
MLDIRQIAQLVKQYAETLKSALTEKVVLQQANLELVQQQVKDQEQIAALKAELAKLLEEDAIEDADFQARIDATTERAIAAEQALASATAEKDAAEVDLDQTLVEIQQLLEPIG